MHWRGNFIQARVGRGYCKAMRARGAGMRVAEAMKQRAVGAGCRMREVRQILRINRSLRVATATAVISFTMLVLLYLCFAPRAPHGVFTVSALGKGEGFLSLCEHESFDRPTANLVGGGSVGLDNISAAWLPANIDEGEGSHSGKDYFAYSFYLRNVRESSCLLTERLVISEETQSAADALRVRVFRDGVPATYARNAAAGGAEPGTIAFHDASTVLNRTAEFAAGQSARYTVVAWFEGDDPQCVDSILGGNVQLAMVFSAQAVEEGASGPPLKEKEAKPAAAPSR